MRNRTPSLHPLCSAMAMLLMIVPDINGYHAQELSWPAAFGQVLSVPADWPNHQINAGSMSVRIYLPPQWTITKPTSEGMLFTAQDLAQGLRLDVEPLTAAGFTLEQPLPSEAVQGSIATVQKNVAARGHEIVGAGQVRAGNRVWVWHESRMKSTLFNVGPIGSGRAWIFSGTPSSQRMTIYCSVLYDRGATPEAMNDKTRRAGAVFAGVLNRLVVESR